jgi:hypothetical protein
MMMMMVVMVDGWKESECSGNAVPIYPDGASALLGLIFQIFNTRPGEVG